MTRFFGGGRRSSDGKDWLSRRRPVSPLLRWKSVLPEIVLLIVSLIVGVGVECEHHGEGKVGLFYVTVGVGSFFKIH